MSTQINGIIVPDEVKDVHSFLQLKKVLETGNYRFLNGPIIERNSPCICGSNKKYKKCCGKDL
jgi:uncharacterized protein YchJ